MHEKTKPPKHLRAATKRWFDSVLDDFELESAETRLLILACEAWDRCNQAREAIAEHGLTFVGKGNIPRMRPEVLIERDSRIAFSRLVRELRLCTTPDEDNRPPRGK